MIIAIALIVILLSSIGAVHRVSKDMESIYEYK